MRALRPLAAMAIALLVVLCSAPPASAHNALVSTEPVADAALDVAPDVVTLTFDGAVDPDLGGIRMVDGHGREIAIGVSEAHGSQVTASLPHLDAGAYVVGWRVTSSDGHPVSGAFTFRVGDAGTVDPGVLEDVLRRSGASAAIGWLGAVVRALLYGALAVVIGTVVLAATTPSWLDGPRRRWRIVLVSAALLALAATVVSIGVEGVDAAGGGLADLSRFDLWHHTLQTRFGRAALGRALALVAIGQLAPALIAWPPPRRRLGVVAAALGAVLVASLVVAGHATSGRLPALGMVVDGAHVAAMATWIGGLVALAAGLRGLATEQQVVLARRFSSLASWSVLVVVASGLVQSWRQVGELDLLTSTSYGKLLVVKVAVVTAMVAAGAANRWSLRGAGPVHRVRRTVGGEVVLGVAVVGVTALLTHAVPAIEQRLRPFSASALSGSTFIELTVEPIEAGRPAAAHLYLQPAGGGLQRIQDLTVDASLPARDLGPIAVPMEEAGPNHYSDESFTLPLAGTWQIDVTGRLGEVDAVQATFTLPIP